MVLQWTGPRDRVSPEAGINPSATILTERRIQKRNEGLVGENPHQHRDLDGAIAAVLAAGAVVQEFYEGETAATYAKRDGSPVTDADLAKAEPVC